MPGFSGLKRQTLSEPTVISKAPSLRSDTRRAMASTSINSRGTVTGCAPAWRLISLTTLSGL